MKIYQWCLSITVLVLAVLCGSLWVVSPLRLVVILLARSTKVPAPNVQVDVQRLYVPSAGGSVHLQTDHYFPQGADLGKAQYPTIMIRSPYGIDIHQGFLAFSAQFNAYYLASHQYHVVVQNTRGRYNSSGEYFPLAHEREDGYATMEWIKAQPWFNGKLGAVGLSYLGWTQYTLYGKDAPIRLQASVPTVSSPTFFNVVHRKDMPIVDVLVPWNFLMETINKTDPRYWEVFVDLFHHSQKIDANLFNVSLHVPLIEADTTYFQNEIYHFNEMFVHYDPEEDYWKSKDASPLLAEVDEDVVHIVGGWYDMFLKDTFRTYAQLVKLGKRPYLTMHHTHHVDTESLFYSCNSIAWLNYKLKGDKSLMRAKPVAYALNPTREVIELDSWPPATTDVTFYLQSGGKINSVAPKEGEKEIYKYTFDPLDPTPILAGNTLTNGGAVDNFPFLMKRQREYGDILLFFGSPFSKDTIITGYPKVKLWVASSIPHADFYVRLLDHDPRTNVSINICDGAVRLADAKTDFFEIEIELDPTAYKIQVGHTIMLEIASSAHPNYSRNPGTGVHLSIATEFIKGDRQVAVASVFPSSITLPVTP